MLNTWIGPKRVKKSEETNELTPGGNPIVKVEYEDGQVEHYSQLMFAQVVSKNACTLEDLRKKRCEPIVSVLLTAFREWGIKLNELQFISMLLNNSLDYNRDNALLKLWRQYDSTLLSIDDVNLIMVDMVLRDKTLVCPQKATSTQKRPSEK